MTAVNDAPTDSSNVGAQTTSVGVGVGPLSLTVGDVETPAGSLTLSGSTTNPTPVPVGNIVLGGAGTARTVTVTPAAGQSGTVTITLTVSDGGATSATSFLLTVTAPPAVVAVDAVGRGPGGAAVTLAYELEPHGQHDRGEPAADGGRRRGPDIGYRPVARRDV